MTENDNIGHNEMLAVGTTLQGGKYRVEKCLASGGFGNTYVVLNTVFEKRLAMKEFFMRGVSERNDHNTVSVSNATNQMSFDGQRAKFRKEARRLFDLHDAHIVQVYDLFDENGTSYYVMEYIDGESLSQRLKRTGRPLTEAEALRVLDQVLEALDEVHKAGLYHLDLKPGNIMLDSSGIVKLIDFGASKQMSASDGYTTTTTALCYTPGYAPQEQIFQKIENMGPWTDLYAVGATLYNVLTRKEPPTDDDEFQFPGGASERTQTLVRWLMSHRRKDRPQSVAQVRQFLAGDFNTPVESKVKASVDERTVIGDKPKESKVVLADGDATVLCDKDKKSTSSSEMQQPRKQKAEKGTKTQKWWWLAGVLLLAVTGVIIGLIVSHASNENGKYSEVDERIVDVNLTPEWTPENKTFNVNGVTFTMVAVEGGTFTMGATSEQGGDANDSDKPAHQVTLSSFYIGQTEVTQALWEVVMGSNPSCFKNANSPVEQVSWNDCQVFLRKLNELTGEQFHLPTEAQWEFAARGGNRSRDYEYSGSNMLDDVAWYGENSGNETHVVGTKLANELGIYDMCGNVLEWCYDRYGDYSSHSQTDPTGPSGGSNRVNRGGGYFHSARFCRVSAREAYGYPSAFLGLRLAL